MADIVRLVVRDILRQINYLPRLPPQLAWRLHPLDFDALVDELRLDWSLYGTPVGWDLNQPSERPDRLYLVGVKVFRDEDAPRYADETATP